MCLKNAGLPGSTLFWSSQDHRFRYLWAPYPWPTTERVGLSPPALMGRTLGWYCSAMIVQIAKQIGGWGGELCGEREVQGAWRLNMLQTWQSDLNPSQSQREWKVRKTDKKEGKNDIDSGRDSNPQPGKWPATQQLGGWDRVLYSDAAHFLVTVEWCPPQL